MASNRVHTRFCLLMAAVASVATRTTADVAYSVNLNHCVSWADGVHVNGSVVCRGPRMNVTLEVLRPFAGIVLTTEITINRDVERRGGGKGGGNNGPNEDSASYKMHSTFDYCKLVTGYGSFDPLVTLIYRSMRRVPNSRLVDACPVQPGLYYARNFLIEDRTIMALLRASDSRLRIDVFNQNMTKIFSADIMGNSRRKGKARRRL